MEIFALAPAQLVQFADRIRRHEIADYDAYMHSLILSVMSELSEFIPSDGAFLCFDNPVRKTREATQSTLTYVAAAGGDAHSLLGQVIPSSSGSVGETYTLAKSIVRKVEADEFIDLDKKHLLQKVKSLLLEPVQIENEVIGVLGMYNKKDPFGFSLRDLKLIKIIAGYISTSIQNAIDAKKSKELSKLDDLTGLFNDRFFHRQLDVEIHASLKKNTPLTLMFMDLDNFKSVNDKHGHLVGSATLKEIAFILREVIDFDAATISRYGGDEYVAIMPGITLERAVEMADRIRQMICTKLFMIDQGDEDGAFVNFKGVISASIGLSSLLEHCPKSGLPKEIKTAFIRLADAAMYRAKDKGKNTVCVADPKWLTGS